MLGRHLPLLGQGHRIASRAAAEEVRKAGEDAFKRLLEPSISGEVIREAKQKADEESIRVFGENLRQLLLSPPVGQKRTMAIDPGFRNGCKIACLDEHGKSPVSTSMEGCCTIPSSTRIRRRTTR